MNKYSTYNIPYILYILSWLVVVIALNALIHEYIVSLKIHVMMHQLE